MKVSWILFAKWSIWQISSIVFFFCIGNAKYPYYISAMATVARPALNICGAKMFDFRRVTVFCLGCRLPKHEMTIHAKNSGGIAPWAPLATPMTGNTIGILTNNLLVATYVLSCICIPVSNTVVEWVFSHVTFVLTGKVVILIVFTTDINVVSFCLFAKLFICILSSGLGNKEVYIKNGRPSCKPWNC